MRVFATEEETMGMSHETCNHPRTPAGRAACRKSGGPRTTPAPVAFVAPTATLAPSTGTFRGLGDVRALAVSLMREHGCGPFWTFDFDNGKRRFGACHYRTRKEVSDGRTFVSLHELGSDERVEEVARMLAGAEITDLSRSHARDLIASGAAE